MKFEQLLAITTDEPVFETGLLLAGDVNAADVHKQLSRWVSAGRVYQLRRGLYALAPPHQRIQPHPFLVANRMVDASYVSLQSALSHYGIIPEYVPVTTSVTAQRGGTWETPLGSYQFRHIQTAWLTGYHQIDLPDNQQAFIATPEKALLDLVYLTPGGDTPEYLASLRLQKLEFLALDDLNTLAAQSQRKKLTRAADNIVRLVRAETNAYETL